MNLKLVYTVLLALIALPLSAQNLANQRFEYITPQDGLSQSTVLSIVQDSAGFMWFGTEEGLNKYDGQNLVVYKTSENDSTTLPSNVIVNLFEDSKGNLWVGTGGGLGLYVPEKDQFKNYTSPDIADPHSGRLSENTINDIYEDSQGTLWIATFNGLNILDRETEVFTTFYHDEEDPQSLSASHIVDLLEDSYGKFWVATDAGIDLMDRSKGTFIRFQSDFGAQEATDFIEVIAEDSKRRLWVGTDKGLYYFDRNAEEFKKIDEKIPDHEILSSVSILSILEDEQGVLWVGTENDGLFAIDEKADRTYHFVSSPDNHYGLNKNSVYNLYESRDNILWIGTIDGGVNYLNRKKSEFKHFVQHPGQENTLSNNSISSFAEDYNGNFWVGTDGGGLNRFDRERELFYPLTHDPENKNSLPSDVILDLHVDQSNQLWIGTYRGGLSRYDVESKTFKNYKSDPDNPTSSISQNEIFAVYEDRNGTIWAGTNGQGLNKMLDEEKGIFKHYKNSDGKINGIKNDFIRDIFEDSKGRFWIASHGRGAILMNREEETFTDYNNYNGKLNTNILINIFEDKNGTLWVGTEGGGIAYYEESSDRFISYTQDDGLPNNTINGILEDDHDNLWLSTNDGISKFNPEAETFKNYGVEDGLQNREFKPGAAYKDKEGFMYFGGINGFNRFHPDSISENREAPPVVFTDFQVFNRSVAVGENSTLKKHINYAEEIELPYTASVITFKFAALNFGSGNDNSYAYKLEGFDSDWNYVGEQNTATYTNLDHGEYTFQLRAANAAGVWGEQIKSVDLIITPPFWRTNWFYLLSVITIAGLVFGGFRYRTRQITELNKRLEKEVNARTQELRESNMDLKNTREELVQNAHKAGMADIATSVLHNIGNVLNSVTTSASISGDVLRKTKLKKLFKANQLLREHKNNLEDFLTNDPKGKKLPDYYLKLDDLLKSELELLSEHNRRLERKVHIINDIIAAQQSYASMGQNFETLSVSQVVEDALTIYANSMERHHIKIEKDIARTNPVNVQKTKLIHVILNVFKNAKESMLEAGVEEKIIQIKAWQDNEQVFVRISDNGAGIKTKHMDKIFNHGFTTKKNGHGFGLHSSANYMTEMGGKIKIDKENTDSGAVFILSLPVAKTSERQKSAGLSEVIKGGLDYD